MQTEANLRASQKYKHTKKGKITKQRDESSEKGKERRKRYMATEGGWEKFKERQKKYYLKRAQDPIKPYKPNSDRFMHQKRVLDIADKFFGEKAIREHGFYELKDKNRMRVDGFYIKNKIILEVNGAQHYFPVRFGNITQERAIKNLESYQRRERIRQQYCFDHGIRFIIIPYTAVTDEEIIEILKRDSFKVLVAKEFEFAYAHRLHNEVLDDEMNEFIFGRCSNKNHHGHNAKLEIQVKGFVDPLTGMVINFVDLKRIVNSIIDKYDHRNLNQDFEFPIATCENFIKILWKELSYELPNLHSLSLWETSSSKCILTRDDIK